jgi:hypothetical protein
VIADTYRVAFNWTNTANSLTATNVMHYHKAGSSAAAVAAIIDGLGTSAMFVGQPTSCSITQLVVTPLDGSGVSFPLTPSTPAHWTGSGGAVDFLPQVAIVIKLLTTKRGRSFRGRVFLPFASEGQVTDGAVVGSTKTSLNTAWIAFHTAATAAGLDWCVASYKLAQQNPVAAVACESATATQRRRMTRTSAV